MKSSLTSISMKPFLASTRGVIAFTAMTTKAVATGDIWKNAAGVATGIVYSDVLKVADGDNAPVSVIREAWVDGTQLNGGEPTAEVKNQLKAAGIKFVEDVDNATASSAAAGTQTTATSGTGSAATSGAGQ